jgi:hypothetical protein
MRLRRNLSWQGHQGVRLPPGRRAPLDPVKARQEAVLAGTTPIPDGYRPCSTCWRVRPLRTDGTLYAHNYCQGAPAPVPTTPKDTA